MNVKKLDNLKDNDIQVAYLEGVIMPNGEFITNGKGQFLKKEDTVFIKD